MGYLPAEMASRHQDDLRRRTDTLMVHELDAYVAPLHAEGLQITPILRTGNPRDVIVQVATTIKAELLILGSHSKRGLLDIALGGTAQQVGKSAPCLVVLVSPKLVQHFVSPLSVKRLVAGKAETNRAAVQIASDGG